MTNGVVYLLRWMTYAWGPADHVVLLPDWPTCEALRTTLAAHEYRAGECRSAPLESVEALSDGCCGEWMGY